MEFMDNDDKKQQLARWLTNKFLQWQTKQGEPRDWRDFAAYLDVGEGALGTWRNKRSLPDIGGVIQIARRYPEIWDVVGVRPPPELLSGGDLSVPPDFSPSVLGRLQQLILWMKDLTEEERLTVLEEALQYKPRIKRVRPVTTEHNRRS